MSVTHIKLSTRKLAVRGTLYTAFALVLVICIALAVPVIKTFMPGFQLLSIVLLFAAIFLLLVFVKKLIHKIESKMH